MSIYQQENSKVMIAQFGTGDIEISNGRILANNEKEMYPCCALTQTNKKHKIGESVSPEDTGPAKQKDCDIALVFTDPLSIDVLIDSLQDVKKRFKVNGTKILTPQEITDEI